MRVSIMGFR